MQYIGLESSDTDPTAAETMVMHLEVLCAWLAGLDEIPEHHRALPWRGIVSLNARRFASFLESLKADWDLIQRLDSLPSRSALRTMTSWTTWQTVRELLVEAESHDCTAF